MGRVTCLTVVMTLSVLGPAATQETTSTPSVSEALKAIRTVCVESFVGEPGIAETVKEIAITGLFSAKRFIVTERCDKADAVLKGAIIERSGTRVRAEGEGANFGVAAGGATATAAAIGAAVGGSSEALYSKETQMQASVTTRLVDKDGVIIWAHTQESPGGKVKGALVDAVERALRQLIKDIERVEVKKKGTIR